MTPSAPENWFEDIYAGSDTTGQGVPWAKLVPAPLLVRWLDTAPPRRPGERVLVVGCGLGDDAAELARRGCRVTAFDVSASAIDLARQRFADLAVDWRVAELFALPDDWQRAFDLVIEHRTIQSLPPEWQARGMAAIAACVAPAGQLLVIADLRPPHSEPDGPPWRLRPEELDAFLDSGLNRQESRESGVPHDRDRSRLVQVYARAAAGQGDAAAVC